MSYHYKQTHSYLHSRLPFPMCSDTFSRLLAVLEARWAQRERKLKDGTNKERSGPGREREQKASQRERERECGGALGASCRVSV